MVVFYQAKLLRKGREYYALRYENLRFKLRKNRRLNTQKTLRFKVNSKIKYIVENINKAKIKRLTERDLLLIMILRERRREKRKPRVWVWPVYGKSSIFQTAAAVSLN